VAIKQNRRLRAEDLDADRKALIGIQTLDGYAPRNPSCTGAALAALGQQITQAQQDEIRAAQALERARNAAIAAEWELHNALLTAKNEVRVQYGDDSDAVQVLGLKKRSERRRPVRGAAKNGQMIQG
jgi:hypothetical protein